MIPKTFCANPLLTPEIVRLPKGDCFDCFVLNEKSCKVMYRIEALLNRLAPMGPDSMRCLWIETVRGDINDWITYERWVVGVDGPSEEKWRDEWLVEFPNEVAWFSVTTSRYKQIHSLIIVDDEIGSITFTNQEEDGEEKAVEYRYDFSAVLLKLESYLKLVLKRIEDEPDSYNQYVEKNLPYYHRYGSIKAREWIKIIPEPQIRFKGSEDIIKVLKTKPEKYPDPMYETMTLRKYMHIWRIAYDAFYENNDWGSDESYKSDPSVTDEEMFTKNSKGREAFNYDLDTEDGFKAWLNENDMFHCCDVAYSIAYLIPRENEEKSGWSVYFYVTWEAYLWAALGAAVALIKNGIAFEFDTKDYINYLKGNFIINIDPCDPRSSVDCPSRFLPYPGEKYTQEQVDRLIAAIKWKKQKKVRLKRRGNK